MLGIIIVNYGNIKNRSYLRFVGRTQLWRCMESRCWRDYWIYGSCSQVERNTPSYVKQNFISVLRKVRQWILRGTWNIVSSVGYLRHISLAIILILLQQHTQNFPFCPLLSLVINFFCVFFISSVIYPILLYFVTLSNTGEDESNIPSN